MLQQTTVTAVIPYYKAFLKRWPTVEALANAKLDEVLQAWAGLGYYSRARNLHKCAQIVATELNGQFPATEPELLKLPGIGSYTAAAIAAIAFDVPANVVDGNVERVLSRLFALTTPLPKLKTEIRPIAATLVPQQRAGDYAQALMDLGATLCTPKSPRCPDCPLRTKCRAYADHTPTDYPRRAPKAIKPTRYGIAFLLTDDRGRLWLRRRPDTGLLAGMIEVPTSAWDSQKPLLKAVHPKVKVQTGWTPLRGQVAHVFSHFELRLSLYIGQLAGPRPAGEWVTLKQSRHLGLPSLTRKIIDMYEKSA